MCIISYNLHCKHRIIRFSKNGLPKNRLTLNFTARFHIFLSTKLQKYIIFQAMLTGGKIFFPPPFKSSQHSLYLHVENISTLALHFLWFSALFQNRTPWFFPENYLRIHSLFVKV